MKLEIYRIRFKIVDKKEKREKMTGERDQV
jgi:hypothetical protein